MQALHKQISSPSARQALVTFSKTKEAQGRAKFHIAQAAKNMDTHITLMKNRISLLHMKQRSAVKSLNSTARLTCKVKEGQGQMQAQAQDSKTTAERALTDNQLKIKKQKEAHRQRLLTAKDKALKEKQLNQRRIRAQSAENQRIISMINEVFNERKRQKATSILDHQRKVRNRRNESAKKFVATLETEFLAKCEEEVRAAQRAKQVLKDLTDYEEGWADSHKATCEISICEQATEDAHGLLDTQVIKQI